jgi:hypothetical protein
MIDQDDHDGIRNLLLWNSITKIDNNTIELSNGTKLRIHSNTGCGGCTSGWYEISELNEVPNMITAVDFETTSGPEEDDYYAGDTSYRIFVYAENKKIKLLEVEGTDGNGYYGTGYWIEVMNEA